MKELGMTTRP
ncbi:hypothetical protein RSAG8_08070, partial [Rhizoctonia solani AG-8 WAC10335]